jgi:type II secretory pathway pseudopilin PulG
LCPSAVLLIYGFHTTSIMPALFPAKRRQARLAFAKYDNASDQRAIEMFRRLYQEKFPI